jgi:choline dehydrogenase-like flavoprotein
MIRCTLEIRLGRMHANSEGRQDFVKQTLTPIWHANGTVKMGSHEDPMTCVDSNLCLKGIQNLRIVDASVLPFTTKYVSVVNPVGWG